MSSQKSPNHRQIVRIGSILCERGPELRPQKPAAPRWESRLGHAGVSRKRIVTCAGRSWWKSGLERDAGTRAVVLTVAGLRKNCGACWSRRAGTDPRVAAARSGTRAAQQCRVGPPGKAGRVVRIYPNKRLMLCVKLTEPEKGLLTRVLTTNFMPGMLLEITGGPDSQWQFSGRLRRRGNGNR